MELKDLPDSELPFMEIAFETLMSSGVTMPESVVRAMRNIPQTEDVTLTEVEFQDINRRLTWLADWGFARKNHQGHFNPLHPPQHHRPLVWHREQARLKHRKQTRQRSSQVAQLVFNYVLSIVGIVLVVVQIMNSAKTEKGDKYSLQALETLKQEVDSLSQKQATDTKTLHELSFRLDSLIIQDTVKHK